MCVGRAVPKGAHETQLEVLLCARSQPRQVAVVKQGKAPECLLFRTKLSARSDREGVLMMS
jgi:hypothetical protein